MTMRDILARVILTGYYLVVGLIPFAPFEVVREVIGSQGFIWGTKEFEAAVVIGNRQAFLGVILGVILWPMVARMIWQTWRSNLRDRGDAQKIP